MATITLTNTTNDNIFVGGILVPALSTEILTDAPNIRAVILANNLRPLVLSGRITMGDGVNPITILDLYTYWAQAGFNTTKSNPPPELYIKSPNGTAWRITINNLGVLSTSVAFP
jgi:hypothetical protein